jgi:inorganic phosphate transporter, PiT family
MNQLLMFVLIILALLFNYLNGFHDSSNIVATIIASRALSPRLALWLVAIAEFCGPFIFGVAVAKAVGEGLVLPQLVNMAFIISVLLSAIFWNLFTWFFGIPSSSSHALIGGMVGVALVSAGWQAINLNGLEKILLALFISPFLGLFLGFLFTRLVLFLARNASLKINSFFKHAQIITGIGLALSHGANDAQKTMGIITLGLVSSGMLTQFEVPTWVIVLSSTAMLLGTTAGGWRLIKTLGGRFYKIRPLHGFCTQVTSVVIILGAALLGGPVSTTQVVSSAIMGAGSAERLNKVRWGVAGQIATAWLLTLPANALLAILFYWFLSHWI